MTVRDILGSVGFIILFTAVMILARSLTVLCYAVTLCSLLLGSSWSLLAHYSPWNPNRYLRSNAGSEYRHSHQSLSPSEIFVRRSPVLMTEPLSERVVKYRNQGILRRKGGSQ